MNILQRILTGSPEQRGVTWPFVSESMNFGGRMYPLFQQQTLIGPKEEVANDFNGLVSGGYAGNGIVFSCLNARMALFTQARPMYRRLRSGTPGELWSNPELEVLRRPWPNGNTSDLLGRMAQDGDLGGNAFIARRPGKLVRLRPDWVTIVHGVNRRTTDAWDPDAEVIGYVYQPGGPGHDPIFFEREEVAHFVPSGLTDPLAPARGMSWLTPLIREIEADTAATTHKLMFFRNGATPNVIVTGVVPAAGQSLQDWVEKYRSKNEGLGNAYKTQFFTAGTSVEVVGKDLQQIDFKVTQGAGETRIASAAGVPPIVAGLSEGLQGSSLNAGNFQSAMRRFADLTGRPWWASAFASLASIVEVPTDSELFYDDRYIPALKDDIKDAADVQAKQAQAIRQYVDAGFEPDSVVEAINAGDLKRLKHSGLYSVQLQLPVPDQPEPKPAPIPAALAEFVKPAEIPAKVSKEGE
jgi:phage portal protein BeeE